MGTYYIPRNLKGESRILYIFSVRSLITTSIGAIVGIFIYFILNMIGLKTIGLIIAAILILIGYACGAIKVPDMGGLKITKNIGGESLGEILLRYIKFKKDKKVYIYTEEEEDIK